MRPQPPGAALASLDHIGRRAPLIPTVTRAARSVPSTAGVGRNRTMLAPGTMRARCPGSKRTIGVSGGTRTRTLKPLDASVSIDPSVRCPTASTFAFVIVVPGCSQGW